jgi:hypothetical protein
MSPVTLSRFLIEEERNKQVIGSDLRFLVEIVSRACKAISIGIGKGSLAGVLGGAGSENVQGEAQKKLDVISNEILLEANEWGGHLAAMASEEMEDPHLIPHRYPMGEYLLVFDPLDGSSNIDVNISVGTIFSVLRCPEGVPAVDDKVFLQPGTQQVCAGFAVYGPTTLLVLTFGNGVHCFTLDREFGHFVLTQENMRIPDETNEFAINMSNSRFWEGVASHVPDRVRRLVLVSTSLGGQRQIGPSGDVLARTIRPRGRSRRDRLDDGYALGVSPEWIAANRAERDAITEWRLAHPQPEWAYYRQLLAGWSWDGLAEAARIAAPTLICAGEADPVVPIANAHALQQVIRDSSLVTFEGRHLFFLEHPARFVDVVAAFLGDGVRA